MACTRPKWGWTTPEGWTANPNKGARYPTQPIACGKCLGCRQDRAREWAIRIVHEAQMHECAWFVTLTYDNEHLPPFASLRLDDVTKDFVKKLRNDNRGREISYFVHGEYGPETMRPHYHMIIFGLPIDDLKRTQSASKGAQYQSAKITETWGRGFVTISEVTPANAAYACGYVVEKQTRAEEKELLRRCDSTTGEERYVAPERLRVSTRPGVGKRWIAKYWRDVYPWDNVIVNGKPCKPPRYYDRWLEKNHPQMWAQVQDQRMENFKPENVRPERLEAKEAKYEQKVSRQSVLKKQRKARARAAFLKNRYTPLAEPMGDA